MSSTDDMNDIVSLGMIRDEQAKRIEELEAELAKALKLIELAVELGRWELNPSFRDEMIDFTEKLTGGKDD